MNIERWQALLQSLGAAPETETFERLAIAYAETHRAYHTARHIEECLSLLDDVRDLADNSAEVECALWFHDAIYKPMSKSNEELSAQWASDFLNRVGVPAESIGRIREHITATRHLRGELPGDSALVVDIDLAIMGAEPARYDEFERDVRIEYRWVPGPIYRRKRAEILQSFLDRPRIYHAGPLFARFEVGARTNLTKSVQRLTGRTWLCIGGIWGCTAKSEIARS